VYFNDGTGRSFTRLAFGQEDGVTYGVATGDLDGDGFTDIGAANSNGRNVFFLNRPVRE